jgi:hypothetical protein
MDADTMRYVESIRIDNAKLITAIYDLEQRIKALEKENTCLSLFGRR